jgi:hypothetical protein
MEQTTERQPLSQHPNLGATTFTCFRKLPAEIGIKIWKLATPDDRVIWIQIDKSAVTDGQASAFEPLLIPSIIHVCHESRAEGQKMYCVGFGLSASEQGQDYWRPDFDTLYLPRYLPPAGWQRSMAFDFAPHVS